MAVSTMAGYKNAMTERRTLEERFFSPRSLGAFLAASYAAGVVITLAFFLFALESQGESTTVIEILTVLLFGSLFPAMYIVFLMAIPMMLYVLVVHLTKAPRGWLDVVVAALLGPLLFRLMAMDMSGVSLVDLVFLSAGVIGGYTYWYLAGRPQPPYKTALQD